MSKLRYRNTVILRWCIDWTSVQDIYYLVLLQTAKLLGEITGTLLDYISIVFSITCQWLQNPGIYMCKPFDFLLVPSSFVEWKTKYYFWKEEGLLLRLAESFAAEQLHHCYQPKEVQLNISYVYYQCLYVCGERLHSIECNEIMCNNDATTIRTY